jgi:hypothetical protein
MVLLASDYDKAKYLKPEDVQHEKKFRIKSVTVDELTGKDGVKENKLIVGFTNHQCGLPLNKTNNRTIRGAFGDDTAGWIGKIIVLFTVMTNMGMGLRVRIPASKPPKQAAATANPSPQPAGPSPSAGNGSTATVKVETAPPVEAAPPVKSPPAPVVPVDPELEPDPVPSTAEEMDDEIPF